MTNPIPIAYPRAIDTQPQDILLQSSDAGSPVVTQMSQVPPMDPLRIGSNMQRSVTTAQVAPGVTQSIMQATTGWTFMVQSARVSGGNLTQMCALKVGNVTVAWGWHTGERELELVGGQTIVVPSAAVLYFWVGNSSTDYLSCSVMGYYEPPDPPNPTPVGGVLPSLVQINEPSQPG